MSTQDGTAKGSKTKDLSEQQIIDNILKNMPATDEVEMVLPSKNRFYSLIDPAKPITIRAMTFEDEKAMMSKKNINTDVLNLLLTRCVSNINISNLLQMDKLFIIMKLRELSYGDEYKANINCESCKKDNIVSFTLSEMPVVYLEEDAVDPCEVDLPVLKTTMKIRRPRVSDEGYFNNADSAIDNLWRFVEEVGGYNSKRIISKILANIPLKDAHVILEALNTTKYGVDTKVRFLCDYCAHNVVMELPITSDFFTEN